MPDGNNWAPRFAVFGDMGNVNAQSIPRLQEETMLGFYDAVLHVGDFAYDMATVNMHIILFSIFKLFYLLEYKTNRIMH